MIKLINGECIEEMSKLESGSFDCVITSPPYNMNLRISKGKHVKHKNTKINQKYLNYEDNLNMDEFYEFNKKVISELLRISNIIFYNVQFLTGNKSALYRLIGYFSENIKEFIIWDKMVAQPAISHGVLNSRWEAILVFSPKEDAISRLFNTAQFNRGCLQNLLQVKRERSCSVTHKAVFPVSLVELLINNFTAERAKILDPFMGSGTTGVACKNLNRNFIGIELDKGYFEIAKDRIESASPLMEFM